MKKKYVLGIIGAGFMANAIAEGVLGAYPKLKRGKIIVSDKDAQARARFERLKIAVTPDNAEVLSNSEFILLAVKPQTLPELENALKKFAPDKIISIMAGVTKARIKDTAGGNCKVARCMPNTPLAYGAGMTALDTTDFEEKDARFIESIFACSGETLSVNESLMNAVTAISGSGPAYVYSFIDSLARAGEKHGLDKHSALFLAANTVLGGAVTVLESDKTIDSLIAAVSSKGGTTVAAMDSLEQSGFSKVIEKAVDACVKRAEELSKI